MGLQYLNPFLFLSIVGVSIIYRCETLACRSGRDHQAHTLLFFFPFPSFLSFDLLSFLFIFISFFLCMIILPVRLGLRDTVGLWPVVAPSAGEG